MADNITLARPYAQAVFDIASAGGSLAGWSAALAAAGAVVSDASMAGLVDDPRISDDELLTLLQSVVADLPGGVNGFFDIAALQGNVAPAVYAAGPYACEAIGLQLLPDGELVCLGLIGAALGGAPGVLIGQAVGGVLFGIAGFWLAYRLVGRYESGKSDPDKGLKFPLMRRRAEAPFNSPRS